MSVKTSNISNISEFKECTTYVYQNEILDLIYPSSKLFETLCTSFDKTYMFFMTVTRCFIYMLITKLYYDNLYPFSSITNAIFLVLLIIIIINFIILLIVMCKNPKYTNYSPKIYNKEDKKPDYDKLILDIDNYKDKKFNLYPELPIY